MPYINVRDTRLYYDIQGADNTETIVFSHGLLWSTYMWKEQVAALSSQYRCIVYDHRGQGKSDVTKAGYEMDNLAEDAAELIKQLCPNQQVHWVGLSMGGYVGQRVAARHGHLLKSLCLLNTSATAEDPRHLPKYRLLTTAVKLLGCWSVASQVMPIMFSPTFLNDSSRYNDYKTFKSILSNNNRSVVHSVMAVVTRPDFTAELKHIKCPTLILAGGEDKALPPAESETLHRLIANSQLTYMEQTGHMSTLERPQLVTSLIKEFLESM